MEAQNISNQTPASGESIIVGEPTQEVARADRFACLNICPHCWHWNITTVKETLITNNVMNGSKVSPLKNWGCATPTCGKVYHMNSQHNHWIWAVVNTNNPAQVRDLKQVKEYLNMTTDIWMTDNYGKLRADRYDPLHAEQAWNAARGYSRGYAHPTPQPFARAQRMGLRGGR